MRLNIKFILLLLVSLLTIDRIYADVVMVVHGLNLKPNAMDSINKLLEKHDYTVIPISLQGHANQDEEQRLQNFEQVTPQKWLKDIGQGFKKAKDLNKGDIHFVGFSLGGLLGVYALAKDEVDFKKMILLAPAIKIRTKSYLLQIFSWWNELTFPSFSPKKYKANWGTPMSAYNSLFQIIEEVDQLPQNKVNIPTLVISDPEDNLTDPEQIKVWIKQNKLYNWKQIKVKQRPQNEYIFNHHLIIDKYTAGLHTWDKISATIINFLR